MRRALGVWHPHTAGLPEASCQNDESKRYLLGVDKPAPTLGVKELDDVAGAHGVDLVKPTFPHELLNVGNLDVPVPFAVETLK